MEKIIFTKDDLADVINTIMAVMRSDEEYRPHNPVIASDGNGIGIESGLHDWKWYTELDGCEAYLNGGDPNEPGESIVEGMDNNHIADFLGLSTDEFEIVE